MKEHLLNHMRRYVSLSSAEETMIEEAISPLSLKKKQIIQEPETLCKGYYFVVKGLLRQYKINQKLQEQLIHFALENWWMSDQEALFHEKRSTSYIQTLEPSEVLFLPVEERKRLFAQSQSIERYFRILSEKALVAAQYRMDLILNRSEEEIYHHFAEQFPGFLQRVPQYMLASYLGFTPQFLSRIRARKS